MENRIKSTSIVEEAKTGDAEDDNDCRGGFATATARDESPYFFRRPVLRNKNSSSVALSSNQSLHPGAFRVAGMNTRARARLESARHDIPAQPVPIGDASDFTDTFEEPVATLTATTVETPIMVDSGAVAVVLTESEEKEVTHPPRKWIFAWCTLVPIGALMVVICIFYFLRPENRSVELVIAPTLPPTTSPTLSNFPEQVDWLVQNDISDETALLEKASPQAKAASWWTPDSKFDASLQRYLLAVFYFAMGGERWESCGEGRSNCAIEGKPRNWLNRDISECEWIGVFCDATGAIIRLDFESARDSTADPDDPIELQNSRVRLEGELPPELRHFTHLEEFLAANMNIQGSLNEFKDFTQLHVLNVENNVLTGTISSDIDTIHPALEVFNVRSNNLTGSLPDALAKLDKLQVLHVDSNDITGTIPSLLGVSPHLETLWLSGNRLHGQIPVKLFSNSNLRELMLGENEALYGTIPATISNMSSLEALDLHATRMEGAIPPELFLVPDLQTLDLSEAQFRGILTEDIRLACDTLRVLRFNDNALSGTIPAELDECIQLEELVLTNTGLTGEISETLCRERGTLESQLSILEVDCTVTCYCCGTRNCPEA